LAENPPATWGKYDHRLKLGGCKSVADGSPQAKTAYFTKPYRTGGPGGEKNWRGKPSVPQDVLNAMVKKCYDEGLQVFIHANGDAAIDMALAAHEHAAGDKPSAERRTTIVHSQFVREDQLKKYVEYNLIPSFYTEHVFFFTAAHAKNRGRGAAAFISPMQTAISLGLRPTNHTDFNVAPIDQMFVLWTAMNRISREGEFIGDKERISVLDALRAITINAARQYGEEATKGSLEPGKLADLVILDNNPLYVSPPTIRDVRVVETVKEGKTIYKAPPAEPEKEAEEKAPASPAAG